MAYYSSENMQPIIKENVSVASVGKNIAPSRLGHREFESRNVKFFTRIFRQNKRYTNMDLAISLGFKSLRSRVLLLQISHFSQFLFHRQFQLYYVNFI